MEIETLGKDGLVFRCINQSSPNQWKAVKGYQVEKVQDAAGAGDWCSAGIINQLCFDGHKSLFGSSLSEIENALRFGQALGALNCQYDGARGLMYHLTAKKLLTAANKLVTSKKMDGLKFPATPLFDISSNLKFEKLYNRR